MSTIGHMPFR